MSAIATVQIHSSQFPEQVETELVNGLAQRRLNPKFLYESRKQTRKWLALHQAFSPSRIDPECEMMYNAAFAGAAKHLHTVPAVHLVGLGCGGGHKDTRLLRLLSQHRKHVGYSPCDISLSMVLIAQETAATVVDRKRCHPLVCDLAALRELPTLLSKHAGTAQQLFTFFGMIPNFEPQSILPQFKALLGPHSHILISANLASEAEYKSGLPHILPQYDNELTRDWLLSFLLDLGFEPGDLELHFKIEEAPPGSGLLRIVAQCVFLEDRQLEFNERTFDFEQGSTLRLFFSYRYTRDSIERLLTEQGLEILGQWIMKSEEEGVFLCRRSG